MAENQWTHDGRKLTAEADRLQMEESAALARALWLQAAELHDQADYAAARARLFSPHIPPYSFLLALPQLLSLSSFGRKVLNTHLGY